MNNNVFDNYLSTIQDNTGAIEWTRSFNFKVNAIASLYRGAIADNLIRGYGNYNSNVVFVFENQEQYDVIFDSLFKVLNTYDCNIYDVYVCFNNDFLLKEIEIIRPRIVYFFFENHVQIQSSDLKVMDIINLEDRLKDTHYIFDRFKYLITYKSL